MLGVGQIGKIVKGIANAKEQGGGLKGAIKGVGKSLTGGDTDDKLDRILAAVETKGENTSVVQPKSLQPLPPGSVPVPGTMANATIPSSLQSSEMLDPNSQTS
tara:strand:- start:300 stop:608 length:309 start_codon:yes stop_codon:yes gene_type:complete